MLSLHPWKRNLLQNIPPHRVLAKSASWRSKQGQQLGSCPHPTGSQPSGRQRASRHGYSTARNTLAFWTGYCLSANNLPKQKSTHKNVFPSSTIENFVTLCMEMPFPVLKLFVGGQFRWLIPWVWAHMQCQKWHSCIHLVFWNMSLSLEE